MVDAYSKYPCIHPTTSTSSKATTDLLEQDFAHFGYPHTIVTDNSTSFLSKEFQTWCRERGIVHLTGAPYHPATNGAAERMVQTFKQALSKSTPTQGSTTGIPPIHHLKRLTQTLCLVKTCSQKAQNQCQHLRSPLFQNLSNHQTPNLAIHVCLLEETMVQKIYGGQPGLKSDHGL